MEAMSIERRIQLALGFTALTVLAELIGGWWAHSLALLSDAAHVFMDLFAMGLTLVALHLSTRPATPTKSYGYHRAEIFAALINGMTLLALSAWIGYEAIHRLLAPQAVKSLAVVIVAGGGLLVNVCVLRTLRVGTHTDLNLHSAYWHVLSDALASIGVVLGAVVIALTGWNAVDSLVSLLIIGLIAIGAVRILNDSTHILLEGVPKGLSLDLVADTLRKVAGVRDVHHLHILSLCSNVYALSSHVRVHDTHLGGLSPLLEAINASLREKFNISHTTIQFEYEECAEEGLLQPIPHTDRHREGSDSHSQ